MIGLNDLPGGKITAGFFIENDVQTVARQLLGKVLVTVFDGRLTAGIIVETEAYNGAADKASHAYGNKRTKRTAVMFCNGGIAYVYMCYGIHYLMNVVVGGKAEPKVVLIRALQPLLGINDMLQRTGKATAGFNLARGPGSLCKAMGISTHHNGMSVFGDLLFFTDVAGVVDDVEIYATARIGVDYAGDDALLKYRYIVQNNRYVSGPRKLNVPGLQ